MRAKLQSLTVVPAKNNPQFDAEFKSMFPVSDKKLKEIGSEKNDRKRFEIAEAAALELYKKKEKELTEDIIRKVEREVYLQVLDTLWMQHLENMQHLREGIQWRSVGQRDPLVEYRSESQKLFESLQSTLRDEVLQLVTRVRPQDLIARVEEDYDTELTRLAESAVEKGVNTVTSGQSNRDDDFKVKKAASKAEANAHKSTVRKKKKAQRQNRKTGRR
jgi:preprotein translocase subunit SecA